MKCMQLVMKMLVVVCVALPSLSLADINITVTKGYDSRTNIAIVPFLWEGKSKLPERIENIIAENLVRTGQYEPLPSSDMLSFPSNEESVYFRDWRLLNQEFLIIGNIERFTEDKVQVQVGLYDVVKNKRVVQITQTVGVYQLRDFAHSVSDLFYEQMTGVKGIFSTKIAFVTRRSLADHEFEYRLQIADADGKRARIMTKSLEPIISVAWSHDGKKLAYANKVGDRWRIFIQEISSGKTSYISDARGYTSAPSFSNEGRYLTYVSSYKNSPEIYIYDFQTAKTERLTRNTYIDTEPSFSPDSKSIIFTSGKGGSPQIYKYDLASKRVERLTFKGSQNQKAHYSSDGKSLVFVHRLNGQDHIAAMDIATGETRALTETNLDESPSIAPNGTMLVYATQRGNRGVLAWVSLDGKVTNEMPNDFGDVFEPAWSPYLN